MFTKGPYKIVTVQLWKLNCFVLWLLNVLVSQNNSSWEFVSNPSSSFRSFLLASKATTFSVSDFLLSITAIRLPAMFVFCVFIRLAVAFILLSFLWPDTDMICRASNPLLSSIVMVVSNWMFSFFFYLRRDRLYMYFLRKVIGNFPHSPYRILASTRNAQSKYKQ